MTEVNKLTYKDRCANAAHFLRCAQANLDNLLVQVPQLKDHPMFQIASKQIEWALADAEGVTATDEK